MLHLNKVVYASILCSSLTACASNINRDDFDNDCDYSRAYLEEMQESARVYYALGSTTVAEVAVVENRVKKAKKGVEEACGG